MRSALVTVPFMLVGLGVATSVHATGPAPQRPACVGCGPDIEVHTLPGAVDIASGTITNDFGSTPVGTPVEYEFAVGATQFLPTLTIASFTVPAGFSVDPAPPSTIEGGASHLVRVLCDATEPGTYSGDVSIVSDDVDESPFTIALTCEVTAVVDEEETTDTTGPTDDAGSGAGIPTTGSSSTTLLVLAGGLLAVGASVRVASRRRV